MFLTNCFNVTATAEIFCLVHVTHEGWQMNGSGQYNLRSAIPFNS